MKICKMCPVTDATQPPFESQWRSAFISEVEQCKGSDGDSVRPLLRQLPISHKECFLWVETLKVHCDITALHP